MKTFDPSILPDYAARLEAVRLYEEYLEAENASEALAARAEPLAMVDELRAAGRKAQDAFDAYDAFGVVLLLIGDDDSVARGVARCFLTGVPLLDSDEVGFALAAAVKQTAEAA